MSESCPPYAVELVQMYEDILHELRAQWTHDDKEIQIKYDTLRELAKESKTRRLQELNQQYIDALQKIQEQQDKEQKALRHRRIQDIKSVLAPSTSWSWIWS